MPTVLELFEERGVFDLESFSVESVVLRLLHHRGDEVIAFSDLRGFQDLSAAPFRCAWYV